MLVDFVMGPVSLKTLAHTIVHGTKYQFKVICNLL